MEKNKKSEKLLLRAYYIFLIIESVFLLTISVIAIYFSMMKFFNGEGIIFLITAIILLSLFYPNWLLFKKIRKLLEKW